MDRNEGDNMPIPIYQFIKDVEKRRIKGLEVLVDLDTLKTFYPAGMRLKNRPKKAMLVEDPRSRFNGEFWGSLSNCNNPHTSLHCLPVLQNCPCTWECSREL